MFKLLCKLLDQWLDPVPGLDDLSSTFDLLNADIDAILAERAIQNEHRNPYV